MVVTLPSSFWEKQWELRHLLSEASTFFSPSRKVYLKKSFFHPLGWDRYMKRSFLFRALLESPLYTRPHSTLVTLLPRMLPSHLAS